MGHRKVFRWLKQKFAASQSASHSQQQGGYQNQQQPSYPSTQSYGQTQSYPPTQSYGQYQSYPPASQGQYPQQNYGAPPSSYSAPAGHQTQQHTQGPPSGHAWSAASDSSLSSDAINLRNQANQEGDAMSRCFHQAHTAHERGDGQAAHDLSTEGHQHQANMKRLNGQAADLIFREKNQRNGPDTIDLHGLYVEEAIDKTEEAVQNGQRQHVSQLKVIVGKGNHSTAHVAKIKPAIERLMKNYNLTAHLDPHNTGVLIVDLSGQQGSRDMGFVHDLARQQPGNDDQCIIS